MKKSEIIDKYNALGESCREIAKSYTDITGKEWDGYIDGGYRMGRGWENHQKWELEAKLQSRENFILSVRKAIEIETSKNNLMKSGEGREFVESLSRKRGELGKELEGIRDEFKTKFDRLMENIGLKDWKVYKGIVPGFNDKNWEIGMTSCREAYLRIHVDIENGKFRMEVGSSLHGGHHPIGTADAQYHQFKAYTVICEHSSLVNDWMDAEYRAMAKKSYGIGEEIRKTEEMMEDPAEAYKKISENLK